MKIAVDAMGGDHAPAEIVKGSVEAAREHGIPIILVGDQDKIKSELAALSASSEPCIEVVHASEVVEMDDHPANAIRRKTDSSIVVAGNLVTKGEAGPWSAPGIQAPLWLWQRSGSDGFKA
jgi:glycerol-3-phosphate acyltransferase PlsX